MEKVSDIIHKVALKHTQGLMFENPNEYKKKILKIFSADSSIIDEYWPQFIEAKARRDIGVHNEWKVNNIYLDKVKAVGLTPPSEKVLTVDTSYLLGVQSCSFNIMKALANHCINKFGPEIFNK